MKKVINPLLVVAVLALIPYVGVEYAGLDYVFGVVIPYAAAAVLVLGLLFRMLDWLRRPVPFNITSTCGQGQSLDWIRQDKIESPSRRWHAAVRVLSEVLLFRSLFRNNKAEFRKGPDIVYGSHKWLWLAGLVFHWSLLVIVVRHARFFLATLPGPVAFLEHADSFLDVTVPALYMTDAIVLAAVSYLVIRRIVDARVRIISLQTDFFPLFLIIGIVLAGISMRYMTRVDIMPVKALATGLAEFSLDAPGEIGALFYVHLFLVCSLAVYFPFSKLVHMGGIFISPTRTMLNNSRAKRHVNPWNAPVKFRTYREYEDEYREKMKKAGIPVEKQ
ncbi:sulfate reduction electron transfer complex DsrMKJOP subunit DsrM [Prosthecochloris sp. HL-130-GSB]|jgi:nitrate reductase gamma subunit|uniref:sulfate reduction electron transfer complex DsrMKJOP subunit DsrM n=1 Tax=Prosthecochloris sp. HL-130-GSB TaxID=1974213 RepID=UPI000A1C07E7|nr:sulfate reduction electron transfer complex DsrMKJOP subunit DsrM [Prosthecochloris sp. HL-130-GSB]ARM30051.1 menaquinol oxidoreductase [Prosthecochloris sp. HL-130-GSB]